MADRLTDHSRLVRAEAIDALAARKVDASDFLSAIIERLQTDSDPWVRAKAASALGEIRAPPDGVVPALTESLRDPDPWVRECAVRALGSVEPDEKSLSAYLKVVASDESEWVRGAATELLNKANHQGRTAAQHSRLQAIRRSRRAAEKRQSAALEVRPTRLILICAIMLILPSLFLLVACLVAASGILFSGPGLSPGEISGPAGLAALVFPFPLGLLLFAEYKAVCRRSILAAFVVWGMCLFFVAFGLIGWVVGLLHLTGFIPPDRDWRSWDELLTCAAFLAYVAFIGVGHHHWYHVLSLQQERCERQATKPNTEEPTESPSAPDA